MKVEPTPQRKPLSPLFGVRRLKNTISPISFVLPQGSSRVPSSSGLVMIDRGEAPKRSPTSFFSGTLRTGITIRLASIQVFFLLIGIDNKGSKVKTFAVFDPSTRSPSRNIVSF